MGNDYKRIYHLHAIIVYQQFICFGGFVGLNLNRVQIDLLEHPAVTNLILLQTVLDEVKNRNSATYSRARGIIQQSDKHAYAFTNEHHR